MVSGTPATLAIYVILGFSCHVPSPQEGKHKAQMYLQKTVDNVCRTQNMSQNTSPGENVMKRRTSECQVATLVGNLESHQWADGWQTTILSWAGAACLFTNDV